MKPMKPLILYIAVLLFLCIQSVTVFGDGSSLSEDMTVIRSKPLPDAFIRQVTSDIRYLRLFSGVNDIYLSGNQVYVVVGKSHGLLVKLNLEKILAAIYMGSPAGECCCPKYTANKYTRTTIVCSDGTNTDTGWQGGDPEKTCGSENAPSDSKNCSTETIPGESFGEGDVTCTTCNYVKYSEPTVDSADCCKASNLVTTVSKSIPGEIESLANSLASAAEAAPMIDDMEFTFSGELSVKMGEECCLPDPCADPVDYEEYGVAISVGVSVTLNVPGWDWEFEQMWNGVYKIKAEISLGPEITLAPSATASVTGKKYDGDCEGCLTFNLKGEIGLTVKFQGTVECTITLEIWPYWDWTVGAHAELGVSTSINANGYYKCCTCSGKGGCVGYGGLEGSAGISFSFLGYDLSFGWSVTILPGYSRCI